MITRPKRCAAFLIVALSSAAVSAASITGSVTYRERMALPPDAVLEVTVESVSLADAPATVIGQISWMPAGQVPIKFEVPYAESAVQDNHHYSVRARITQGGKMIYTTTRSYPVLTLGAGKKVDMMMLQRVTQAAQPDRMLTDTYWKLTELNGAAVKVVPKQREAHMILQREGNRLVGSGGCNRMTGAYTLDGPSVSFDKVMSTMMACVEGSEQESGFFQILGTIRSWKVQGDSLNLLDQSGAVIARFVAVDLK